MEKNEDFKDKAKKIINDVKDNSNSFEKKDIESGKVMGILSYLGILALIPFFSEKNNKYVIFHAKQGMNLFVIEIIISVGLNFIGILLPHFLRNLCNTLVELSVFALSIIGIINVCNGKAKELPIVNKIKIIK